MTPGRLLCYGAVGRFVDLYGPKVNTGDSSELGVVGRALDSLAAIGGLRSYPRAASLSWGYLLSLSC